jgi:protein-S-isoprenylcysteine O-methyltransferase Ste14
MKIREKRNIFPKRQHFSERPDLAGEHPAGDMGQIILAIIFFIIWFTDSFVLSWTVFLQEYVPLYLSIISAVIIAVLACYFEVKAHNIMLKEIRKTSIVVDKSVFKVVRHPLYLGSILFYLALIVSTLSLAAVGIWIIIFFFYDYISAYEEKLLEIKYGDAYREYEKKVAKWIPGIW